MRIEDSHKALVPCFFWIVSCLFAAPTLGENGTSRVDGLIEAQTLEASLGTESGAEGTPQNSAPAQRGIGDKPRTDSTPPAAIEEIVVTAQRREESLQKASVAIQVLSPSELANAGVTSVQDLTTLVPGLQVGNFGSSSQIYIRGVGELSGITLSNPAVAVNVDGVYIARPEAIGGQFYDLARIEVLKGPQGTLYGRNATGGAINLITNRPSLDKFNGYLNVEAGNYAEINTDGAINIPLSSTWAVRAAFQIVSHRPYLSDHTDDAHQKGGRIEGLWEPNDGLSVLLQADYTYFGGHGGGASAARFPNIPPGTSPWLGISDPRADAARQALTLAAGLCTPNSALPPGVISAPPPLGLGPPPACAPGSTNILSPHTETAFQDSTIWGAHAELNQDLGFATLTFIPAFRSVDVAYLTNLGLVLYNIEPSKETTVELRLSRATDRLKWVAGAYYFHENQSAVSSAWGGLFLNNTTVEEVRSRSAAAFGEATVSIADSMRLIAGLRYTHDSRFVGGSTADNYPDLACFDPARPSCFSESFGGTRTYTQPTWKTGVEYDLAQNNMLYATASTGFKAGGLNDSAGSEEYKPEKLLAFEFGSRNTFLQQRLQVNAEAFYWKYTNQQNPHVVIDAIGNPAFNIENAGHARLYGVDLDLTAKPTSADTVGAALEYLNSRYDVFTFRTPSFVAPVQGVSTGCAVTTGPVSATVDCSGFQLLTAPLWSGSAAFEHRFSLTNGANVVAHIDAQFASPRWVSIQFLPQAHVPSYVVETMTLGYVAADEKWSLTAFVRNLTNRAVYTTGTVDGFVPGQLAVSVEPPRTYGIRANVKF